jgi:hypothetical protein
MFERKQRAGIKLRSPILRWLEDAENDWWEPKVKKRGRRKMIKNGYLL